MNDRVSSTPSATPLNPLAPRATEGNSLPAQPETSLSDLFKRAYTNFRRFVSLDALSETHVNEMLTKLQAAHEYVVASSTRTVEGATLVTSDNPLGTPVGRSSSTSLGPWLQTGSSCPSSLDSRIHRYSLNIVVSEEAVKLLDQVLIKHNASASYKFSSGTARRALERYDTVTVYLTGEVSEDTEQQLRTIAQQHLFPYNGDRAAADALFGTQLSPGLTRAPFNEVGEAPWGELISYLKESRSDLGAQIDELLNGRLRGIPELSTGAYLAVREMLAAKGIRIEFHPEQDRFSVGSTGDQELIPLGASRFESLREAARAATSLAGEEVSTNTICYLFDGRSPLLPEVDTELAERVASFLVNTSEANEHFDALGEGARAAIEESALYRAIARFNTEELSSTERTLLSLATPCVFAGDSVLLDWMPNQIDDPDMRIGPSGYYFVGGVHPDSNTAYTESEVYSAFLHCIGIAVACEQHGHTPGFDTAVQQQHELRAALLAAGYPFRSAQEVRDHPLVARVVKILEEKGVSFQDATLSQVLDRLVQGGRSLGR